jgi:dienelactone hydrolase
VVDQRLPASMERSGYSDCPSLVSETSRYSIFQVRWPVLKNADDTGIVYGEGLLIEPINKPLGYVVAIPDADNSPEEIAGLNAGLLPKNHYARRLAENGFEVIVPILLNRSVYGPFGQSQREWIYRQAFHMGRHVIGYEVQKVLSAVDWFETQRDPDAKIGVVGFREGGLVAFYASAVDTRIDAALVSGYFNSRQELNSEPLYRNVWGLLKEFGDAEIATLIAPRGLVVEYSDVPETPSFEAVSAEFGRIEALAGPGMLNQKLIHGEGNNPENRPVDIWISPKALISFADMLGIVSSMDLAEDLPVDARIKLDTETRQRRQVLNMENHVQALVDVSPVTRNQFFLAKIDPSLPGFANELPKYRKFFWEEILGRIEDDYLPLNPRSRQFKDDPLWVAYDVVLDVWPDVFAWGLYLRPKDIQSKEKRPVVVVQPGLECVPSDALDREQEGTWGVAARLADQGFVVFVPQNLYRGRDDFRNIDKKAKGIGLTMWSVMIGQHNQILSWLETLSYVDPSRIGFYGCSYGGTTAMYLVPLVEKYSLSICSANFNNWTCKIASTRTVTDNDYMLTAQWEFPTFDMGSTFSHAEMAYLMIPRPFMVERGRQDNVGRDDVILAEYEKVSRLYTQLGLGNKTEIEILDDIHGFLCKGSFKFLHKHLNWPER